LLFNEAISVIDNITKKLIHESLKNWGKGRTILTIAYCLSIVKGANKIIFLENREVKERGSYIKLLN